jgi:hypothetical protein
MSLEKFGQINTAKKESIEEESGKEAHITEKLLTYEKRILDGDLEIENLEEEVGPFANRVMESFVNKIPTKYRDLPPELAEEMWVPPIYVDPKKNALNQKVRQLALECHKRTWTGVQLSEMETEKSAQISEPESREASPDQEKYIPTQEIKLENNIERNSTQEAFGDTNGSYDSFIEHLQNRGLIGVYGDSLSWTGGDTRTVFVGDILGDRSPEGLKTYSALMDLRVQAEAAGGSLSWLAGNHDNMCNAVLGGFTVENGVSVEKDMNNRLTSYAGNLEWGQFLTEEKLSVFIDSIKTDGGRVLGDMEKILDKKMRVLKTIENSDDFKDDVKESYRETVIDLQKSIENLEKILGSDDPDAQKIYLQLLKYSEFLPKEQLTALGSEIINSREEIKVKTLKERPEIIEAMCSQEIINLQDDLLYVHTNFTEKMYDIISIYMKQSDSLSDAVNQINSFYQNTLRWYLSPIPRNPTELSKEHVDFFNKLRDEFVSTSKESRVNYTENININAEKKQEVTDRMKDLGVRMVIHGHSDEEGEVMGDTDGKLPILSIDRSAYKGEGKSVKKPIAHASVATSGVVSYH